MFGENTLFFTKKGFKKISELKLYDEVLTIYGKFEPITYLGKWQPVDKRVEVSTGEVICCDNDILWNVHDVLARHDDFKYTDELEDGGNYIFTDIQEIEYTKTVSLMNPYKYAVVVPTEVPNAYLTAGFAIRMLFFAGLVDSPICECEPGGIRGKYVFYTRYKNVEIGIIALARTFGWNVKSELIEGVKVISVYVCRYWDEIPVQDELKRLTGAFKNNYHIKVNNVRDLSADYNIYGRKVVVNGSFPLIGYSMLPVK